MDIVNWSVGKLGRAPHGARGLKRYREGIEASDIGRAPHGARGLKRVVAALMASVHGSRPTRGAWIETVESEKYFVGLSVAPHTGRVD